MKIRYKYSLISDVGNLRKNNEDNFFVFGEENRNPKNNIYSCNGEFVNEKAFFCVCDGMGGHSAGEVASYIATHQVQKNYNSITDKIKFEKDVSNVMKSFISSINDSIYNTTEEKPELKSMGTTLTGIYFLKDGAYAINIGDSRVYELENEIIIDVDNVIKYYLSSYSENIEKIEIESRINNLVKAIEEGGVSVKYINERIKNLEELKNNYSESKSFFDLNIKNLDFEKKKLLLSLMIEKIILNGKTAHIFYGI